MKPKLVRIPKDRINHTEQGILVKVNDKLFVLVESEAVNGTHIGMEVFVKDFDGQDWQKRRLREYRPNNAYPYDCSRLSEPRAYSECFKMAKLAEDASSLGNPTLPTLAPVMDRGHTTYLSDHRTTSLPRWTVISRKFGIRENGGQFKYHTDHVQSNTPHESLTVARTKNRPNIIEPLFVFAGTHSPIWESGKTLGLGLDKEFWYTMLLVSQSLAMEHYTVVNARSLVEAMYKRPTGYTVVLVFQGRPKISWDRSMGMAKIK